MGPAGTIGGQLDIIPHTHPSSTRAQAHCPLPAPAQWPSAEPGLHAGPLVAALAATGLQRLSRVLPLHAATSKGTAIRVCWPPQLERKR